MHKHPRGWCNSSGGLVAPVTGELDSGWRDLGPRGTTPQSGKCTLFVVVVFAAVHSL